jgi:hypothetical protein
MFKGDGWRAAVWRTAGAALTAVLLASCGGGDQIDQFQPSRVVVFGDESSLIENVPNDADDPDGVNSRNYSVNYKADAATARDCRVYPVWSQAVALYYGILFPECNPGGAASTTGQMRAVAGAHAADLKQQISSFEANDAFVDGTLVTVLIGQHDVLDQYLAIKDGTTTFDDATKVLEAAGTALSVQVNRIAKAGGKVLIATVPDLGLTPFGRNEGEAGSESLTQLARSFNNKLRGGLINDGRKIGLILTDEMIEAMVTSDSYNWTDPACTVDVPACSTLTLATTTTPTMPALPTRTTVDSWVWADATHMGAGAQTVLGTRAADRASGNPF